MIKSFNDAQMTEVYRQAMKQDFPPDELKPLSRILAQKRKNIALCLGYFEQDKLIGYAAVSYTHLFFPTAAICATRTVPIC